MFETGPQMAEYETGMGEYEQSAFGQGYGPGEYEQAGYGPGEYEQASYGPGEYEQAGYGPGEYEQPGYGPGEYEGEYEDYGQGEEEDGQGESEERFLPLIPIAGKVLGGLLGGLLREGEYEQSENGQGESPEGGAGEAEEQFLHKVFLRVLGQQAESDEAALSPAQESQFATQLLEADSEDELAQIIGRIVNTVGRAVQGIRGAANSPQGRAIINAVTPLAGAALPGGGAGSLLESESGGMDQEQDRFETANRVVQLTSAAARDVAMAPAGAPPQLVGELGIIRAARFAAPRLFNHALRSISPLARRYYGRRYYSFGRGWGRPYGRWYGYGPRRYWGGYRPAWGRYGYRYPGASAYPVPSAEPSPEPGPAPEPPPPPPRPGYRWVAVPIGAPPPPEMAPPPPPPGPPGPGADAPSSDPGAAAQSEFGYRRYRRRYRGYGGSRGYGSYGVYGGAGGGEEDDGGGGGSGSPSGRWIRRDGRIILLGA